MGGVGLLLIATNIASPARSASGDEVMLNGAEALKFLVGKTLRSVGNGKSAPDRRYFLTETVEYYCRGWNPSEVPPKDRTRLAEAAGCDLLLVSIKESRLCQSAQYEQCADRSFSLIFTPRSSSASARDGQILGRAKLDPNPLDSRTNEFDLVQGNTIFPTFDPASQPQLLQPDVGQHAAETHYCGTTLTDAEATARLIGAP
ncbi:hypothetical protein [Bradyrhizobium sp. BR 1432]|uniref:hypothetical protein n=1 Tax=Bradyrhizobium sp. BR 1432 TaxID=3447966 RepID=UPI003EE6BA1E